MCGSSFFYVTQLFYFYSI